MANTLKLHRDGGVGFIDWLGIFWFYRPSKNAGNDSSVVPPFNRDQQHRSRRFVYDIRFGRINESCMIGCAVTRNRSAISVLAPNDQGSDFIELDFVRPCAFSRSRWLRVPYRVACAFFRAQTRGSSFNVECDASSRIGEDTATAQSHEKDE